MKSVVLFLTCALLAAQPVRAQESSLFSSRPNRGDQARGFQTQERSRPHSGASVFSRQIDSQYLWEKERGIVSIAGFFRDFDQSELPLGRIEDDHSFGSLGSRTRNLPTNDSSRTGAAAARTDQDRVILIAATELESRSSDAHAGDDIAGKSIEPLSPIQTEFFAVGTGGGEQWDPLSGELPSPISSDLTQPSGVVTGNAAAVPTLPGGFVPEEQRSSFTIQIDSMFLHLSGGGRSYVPSPAFLIKPGAAGMPLQSVEDSRFLAVPRITIGRSTPGETGWELSAFGRNDWQKSTGSMTTDGTQSASLASHILSGEANWLMPIDPLSHVQLLAGARYFQFGEHLDLMSSQNTFTATSAVSNNLFGGQIGARFSHERKNWTVIATGKFGVFDNSVTVHEASLVTGVYPDSRLNGISFATDIGVTARYPISQSCSFNAGYQFFLLDGVARAVGQVDRSGPVIGVNAKDNCILHGPVAGLEFRF